MNKKKSKNKSDSAKFLGICLGKYCSNFQSLRSLKDLVFFLPFFFSEQDLVEFLTKIGDLGNFENFVHIFNLHKHKKDIHCSTQRSRSATVLECH